MNSKILFNSPDFEKPKPELEQYSTPPDIAFEIIKKVNSAGNLSGKIADLVIWDEDPLEPSAMPEYVFINGENMDLTSRATRLTDRYTKDLDEPVIYRD